MSAVVPDSASASECVLEFLHVTKWYGTVAALTDVSFRVGCEVVGLVGRNGVGKTTLLKLAAGLLSPSQGHVRIGGAAAGTITARGRVGFCPDIDRFPEHQSAVGFVASLLRYHGASGARARARARDVLADLGLAEHMERPLRTFSKGMRQRVRLAQALAHEPRVVLLDEPMTGLDPVARSEVGRIVAELPRRGVGVLVSSHVLHELEALVDRVVFVHEGRLLAVGRVDELRSQIPDLPHRVRILAGRTRAFAAELLQLPQVEGVRIHGEAVEVEVSGAAGFYEALTELGAAWPEGIDEVVPLDDDLASVFGHLVG